MDYHEKLVGRVVLLTSQLYLEPKNLLLEQISERVKDASAELLSSIIRSDRQQFHGSLSGGGCLRGGIREEVVSKCCSILKDSGSLASMSPLEVASGEP